MKLRNENYQADVESVFASAPFIKELGIRLISAEVGECRAEVEVCPMHLQHLHLVHGGVISSLAGHAALGAAISVAAAGETLVTPTFSFDLFRSVSSGKLQAIARVVKAGAIMVFTEASIYLPENGKELLIAKGNFTFVRSYIPQK